MHAKCTEKEDTFFTSERKAGRIIPYIWAVSPERKTELLFIF